jgi:hypothetical protein
LRAEAQTQEVCVPFGAYAGSHSHLDRLGVQIFPWSTDPGTPLYGVDARTTWYQQTAAHNVLVVDGKSQTKCGGKLVGWNTAPGSTKLRLESDTLYPDVRTSRELTLTNGVFKDSFSVEAEHEHAFDWLMHVDGECRFDNVIGDAEVKLGEGPYEFLARMAHRDAVQLFQFDLRHADKTYRITLASETRFDVIIARSPAHVATPTQPRQTIFARARARRINLVATSEMVA